MVFTGGRSLHRVTVDLAGAGKTHLFPSGVGTAHYATSRNQRRPRERPVAGYVGVLDERLDPSLLAELAAGLADWTIRLVGPTSKISPAMLPRARNI